jgi:hypothetical protein
MARKEGLRPIGDSVKKIIERIKKEREERQKKGKPIRTQPKLPGLKKGGDVQKMMSGGFGIFSKKKAKADEPDKKESNEAKKKKRLEELKKEIDGMKKGGLKSPKPGTYEYYLLNRPKHSPAPIKPQKMDKGGRVKKPIKVKKIAIGIGKAKDYPGIKKIIEMNKKGKKRFAEGGMIPKTPKQKKFAALAEPRDKITYADKIAGATGKSKKMKQGGMARGGGAAIRGNNFKGVY